MANDFLQELKTKVNEHEIDSAQERALRIAQIGERYVGMMRKRLVKSATERGKVYAVLTLNDLDKHEGAGLPNDNSPLAKDGLDYARATFVQEGFETAFEDVSNDRLRQGPSFQLRAWVSPSPKE